MYCGCSTARGCARWLCILLLLAAGVALSVFHTLEVNDCVKCDLVPNQQGELQRVCTDYHGSDMNWSGAAACSGLYVYVSVACQWVQVADNSLFYCLQAWKIAASRHSSSPQPVSCSASFWQLPCACVWHASPPPAARVE